MLKEEEDGHHLDEWLIGKVRYSFVQGGGGEGTANLCTI